MLDNFKALAMHAILRQAAAQSAFVMEELQANQSFENSLLIALRTCDIRQLEYF
jgi:hypothetical protein